MDQKLTDKVRREIAEILLRNNIGHTLMIMSDKEQICLNEYVSIDPNPLITHFHDIIKEVLDEALEHCNGSTQYHFHPDTKN